MDKFVLDVPKALPIEENPAQEIPLQEKSSFSME
jgi:hypothetical protein